MTNNLQSTLSKIKNTIINSSLFLIFTRRPYNIILFLVLCIISLIYIAYLELSIFNFYFIKYLLYVCVAMIIMGPAFYTNINLFNLKYSDNRIIKVIQQSFVYFILILICRFILLILFNCDFSTLFGTNYCDSEDEDTAKTSVYGNIDVNHVPSPTDLDLTIKSPYEENIPLVELLDSILSFNTLEFLIISVLLLVFFNKTIKTFVIKYIKIFITKYVPVKYDYINKYLDRLLINNDIFDSYFISINLVILFCIKFVHINFVYILYNNIEDFVLVYNSIHKSSLFLIIMPALKYKINIKELNRIYLKDLFSRFNKIFIALRFIFLFIICYIFINCTLIFYSLIF